MSRLIHRHPSPGCTGKTVTVEYTEAEYAGACFSAATRAALDAGQPVAMGDMTIVDPVAFYHAATRTIDRALQAVS